MSLTSRVSQNDDVSQKSNNRNDLENSNINNNFDNNKRLSMPKMNMRHLSPELFRNRNCDNLDRVESPLRS